jgi:hypothetical protein
VCRYDSPAKTVADCFKYRNKIGAEIAVEALKDEIYLVRCCGARVAVIRM